MSTALHQLTISEISCRNLRSADMFGKNDVYVVFRVGTKKVKTHHKKNAGKHATFDEILTMNLEDHDLEHGIDVGAYDYDVGSSDDLLGQGKLVNLLALKRTPNAPRQFKEPFKYKAVWKSSSAPYAQFFTKSFLGDGAALLARSSAEERAPPRYRAGVASMA